MDALKVLTGGVGERRLDSPYQRDDQLGESGYEPKRLTARFKLWLPEELRWGQLGVFAQYYKYESFYASLLPLPDVHKMSISALRSEASHPTRVQQSLGAVYLQLAIG